LRLVATELLWFLRGDTNIRYLVDNNCHIWDGDAYKNYSKLFTPDFHGPRYNQDQFIEMIQTNNAFARDFGDLGPVYGAQWRGWFKPEYVMNNDFETTLQPVEVDQIQNLINDLKTNPDSRRLMVNAWNVGEIDHMVLPPCHYGFQVYTREGKSGKRYISLMWNQRSVDTFLGLPFNIASYALLLEIIAREVDMIPDELIGNLGDVHLYSNHIEQAKEQLTREPMPLSNLVINDEFWNPDASFIDQIEHIQPTDFFIKDYQSHPAIKAPLSN
jgi:thymidylate synthase